MDFDWDITKRELVVFIPNFNRKKLLDFSLSKIATSIPEKDWCIVIGNDGIHNDFDQHNVYSFTLNRTMPIERNGAFIRNYFIKRCKSKRIFQKDPEIVIVGDFIKGALEHDAYRIGWERALNDMVTERYIGGIDPFVAYGKIRTTEQVADRSKLIELKLDILRKCGTSQPHPAACFHWGFSVETSLLQRIRGYDERFAYYGPEDQDMFVRLIQHVSFFADKEVMATHLWHPMPDRDNRKLGMFALYHKKSVDEECNTIEWGEG